MGTVRGHDGAGMMMRLWRLLRSIGFVCPIHDRWALLRTCPSCASLASLPMPVPPKYKPLRLRRKRKPPRATRAKKSRRGAR